MTFPFDFHFVFKSGTSTKAPILLLHGTGGNEHDLLGFAETVAPGRSVLSPRGKVLENGKPRFFRRFAEGKLDEDDIRFRAQELATFIRSAQIEYNIQAPIALGYSNGANIAAALLVTDPNLLAGAVLLRAMAPFKIMPTVQLNKTPVLLLSGTQDQMIPLSDATRLAETLRNTGASITHELIQTGHGLTQSDVTHITNFFANAE